MSEPRSQQPTGTRRRSLRAGSLAELRAREEKRGRRYKPLRGQPKSRRPAASVQRDAATTATAAPPAPVVVSTDRRPGTARERRGTIVSELYLDAVRRRPCGFCGRPGPSTAHHVAVRGMRGDRSDLSAVPACMGPGTPDCHSRAQRYEIAREVQWRVLGETIAHLWGDGLGVSEKTAVLDEARRNLDGRRG